MPYLLNSVYLLAQSEHALKIQLHDSHRTSLLIDADGSRLMAWRLESEHQPYLIGNFHLDFESDILALAPIKKSKKSDEIAVLLESLLEVLCTLLSAFAPRFIVPFLPTVGHQDSLEISPILLSHTMESDSFLILYKYTGFVTIFNLEVLRLKKHVLRKRGRKPSPGSKTFSIGNIVVSLMAISKTKDDPIVAILYRDIDFNFSLRYYTFRADLSSFIMVRQMENFLGAPSHVMAVESGFVVASDTQMWFFPLSGNTVSLAESVGDSIYPVSYNKLHNVVTLNMSAGADSYLGSRTECSTQIDKNRYMLVSDSGTTFIMYIETTSSHAMTTVNQFQVVDVGKSTIATDLVHLEDNVFYAGSRNSRSILFRILPRAPHIDVLSCMSNVSPILNASYHEGMHRSSLLLSRGGFHSGELELVNDSSYRIERHYVMHMDNEPFSFSVANHNGSDVIIVKDGSEKVVKSLTYPSLSLQPLGLLNVSANEKMHALPKGTSDEMCRSWVVDALRTIEVAQGGTFLITLKSRKTLSVFMDGGDQVSCIDWDTEGEILNVYISLWNGKLFHVLFTTDDAKLIGLVATGLQGMTTLTQYASSASQFLIVLLDAEGLIFVMPYLVIGNSKPVWNRTDLQYLKASHTSGTFRLSRGQAGVLVYDAFCLYHLHPITHCRARLQLTKVHAFRYRLRKCELMKKSNDSGELLILFEDGTLGQYLIENRRGMNDTYNSDGLILQSVNVSKRYTVALKLDSKPNKSTGHMDIILSLLLFERLSLKLLHIYEPRRHANFVDICVMSEQYGHDKQGYIVVANSTEDPLELIQVFRVSLGKIEPVPRVSITGSIPQTFSLSRIACNKNTICLVGDVYLTFTLDTNSGGQLWRGTAMQHDTSPFYGADVDGNDDFWVLADAVRGLFLVSPRENYIHSVPTPFGSSFATAVAVLKTKPVFVYGDAEGNVWAAQHTRECLSCCNKPGLFCSRCFATIFSANLGEQINDITVVLESPTVILFATVKGNVYRVQDIKEYSLAQDYLAKKLEGPAADTGLLKRRNQYLLGLSSGLLDCRAPETLVEDSSTCSPALQIEIANLSSGMGTM